MDAAEDGLAGVAASPAGRLDLEVVATPGVDAERLAAAGHADPLLGGLVALHLRHDRLYSPAATAGGSSATAFGVGTGSVDCSAGCWAGFAVGFSAGAAAFAAGLAGAPFTFSAVGAAASDSADLVFCGGWSFGLWVDAIVMNIDLPSSTGARSTTAWSLTCSVNRPSSWRPSSGWVSSRP